MTEVINDEFQAVPVDFQLVEARILVRSVLYVVGINDYVWPCAEQNCTSLISHAVQFCAYGFFCVDDEWSISVGLTIDTWDSYWWQKSSRIDFATKMVHQFRSNQSAALSTHGLQAEKYVWNNKAVQAMYKLVASLLSFYFSSVLSILGEPIVSGPEELLDGICDMTPQEMREMCASKEMKELIIADMSQGRCAVVYTACLVLWVLVKSVHDLLLLSGCKEELSLHCGLLSIPVQGALAASSGLLFIAACEVFVAHVPDQHFQCYYKMRDLDAMIFLATPFVLTMVYYKKLHTINLSLLVGDVLYYRSFDIPFRFVKTHEGWPSNGLMQPTVTGSTAQQELCERRIPSYSLLVSWSSFFGLTNICIMLIGVLVWGVFFAKMMMLLTMMAMEPELQLRLPAKLLLGAPALLCFLSMIWSCRSLLGLDYSAANKVVSVVSAAFLPFFMLCLMPPLDLVAGRAPAEVDLLWCSTRWTVAGGLFTLSMFSRIFFNLNGGHKIKNTVDACLSYHRDYNLDTSAFHSALPTWGSQLEHRYLLPEYELPTSEECHYKYSKLRPCPD